MSTATHRTRYIILRKTPFRDTSLVVSGISPQFGRLDFVIKGARVIGKRKFPEADIFHEFSIEFRAPRHVDSMPFLSSLELMVSRSGLANSIECYLSACEMASVLIRYAQPMLEIPIAYQAFSAMLSRMEKCMSPEPAQMFARIAFLHEHGLLPYKTPYPELIEPFLLCALDAEAPCPRLDESVFRQMEDWTKTQFRPVIF